MSERKEVKSRLLKKTKGNTIVICNLPFTLRLGRLGPFLSTFRNRKPNLSLHQMLQLNKQHRKFRTLCRHCNVTTAVWSWMNSTKSKPLWSNPSPQHTISAFSQAERASNAESAKANLCIGGHVHCKRLCIDKQNPAHVLELLGY